MVNILRSAAATTPAEKRQSDPLLTHTPAIEVFNLVKRYRKASRNAVDGVSFEVKRGEIFGFLGPNGAGKTTTISILTTRVRPTSGGAMIMGIDVGLDPVMVKRRIAVVPQWSNLDSSLRAREILTFHAAYHGMPRAERETRADLLLEELGLRERAHEKVEKFSGGLMQRLMLARAQMHSPDILFLDEPTRSLDPQSRIFLWERVRLLREQGITIFLSTHDIDEAERLCDRVAIMDHGHILVIDTPAALKGLIPAGERMEILVQLPEALVASPHADDDLLQLLQKLPGVLSVEMLPEKGTQPEHRFFCLSTKDSASLMGRVVQAMGTAGIEIRDIHLKPSTLEDVFIFLTGRNLRS